MTNCGGKRVLSLKFLAFNVVTTPDQESGLSLLQAACIEGDIATVGVILNYSPDKLHSAIALSLKISYNATNSAGKSIDEVLRQVDSKEHKQIRECVEKVTKHFESKSLLHLAAREGCVEHLRRLLDCGEYIDSWSKDYKTPLMLAAKFNEEGVVEFLVQKGASLEIEDLNQFRPIDFAAEQGKTRNVLRLIELGATISKGKAYMSPFHLALKNGHPETVRLLLEHGAKIEKADDYGNPSSLMLAAQMGDLDAIHFFLKEGGNLSERDKNGMSALHYAVRGCHIDVVKFILQKPGNVLTETSGRETVLHLATDLELVRYLVKQGANIHAKDCLGTTALHNAAEKGQSDTVNYLLDQGADINAQVDYCLLECGRSALSYAIYGSHAATAKLLIERECDLNFEFHDLLVLAASRGLKDVLQLLLDKGSHNAVDIVSSSRETPLTAAARAGEYDIVTFLLERGASVNGKNSASGCEDNVKDGDEYMRSYICPLYCALERSHVEVANLLIERGADIHAKNCFGTTPLHWAASMDRSDIVSYLLNQGADINSREESGHSALYYTFGRRHTGATAKVLIERGCNDRSLFSWAASFGRTEILKLLFDRGLYDSVDTVNCRGETPLTVAACAGNYNMVTFLLERGASVNGSNAAKIENSEGSCVVLENRDSEDSQNDTNSYQGRNISPLFYAISAGHVDLAKLLIERGADTSSLGNEYVSLAELAVKWCPRDIVQLLSLKETFDFDKLLNGETMLTLTTSRELQDPDLVQLLLKKGINVNAKNVLGDTALSCLLKFSGFPVVMKIAKLLLSFGADINTVNDRSETPLQIACYRNFEEVAELLLKLGCQTNVKDVSSYCPLHHAAHNNNGKLVEILVRYGADTNIQTNQEKTTPLLELVKSNITHAAEVLVGHGAELEIKNALGRTSLAEAAACGNLSMVQLLVESSVKYRADTNIKTDQEKKTPLLELVKSNSIHAAKVLIEHGAELEVKNALGRTPLAEAAACGNLPMVQLLIEKGNNVHTKDNQGRTPLILAVGSLRQGHSEVEIIPLSKILLDHGSVVNDTDHFGRSPLHYLPPNVTREFCDLLLQNGADVNLPDNNRKTPLYFAIRAFNRGYMESLIEHGADVGALDRQNRSPLHAAAYLAVGTYAVELLIQHGADVHYADNMGWLPLHFAAVGGRSRAVDVLFQNGSDITTVDNKGRTVFHLTARNGIHVGSLIDILLRHRNDVIAKDFSGRTVLGW